jgi:superfamily II DNA/RNA helicase
MAVAFLTNSVRLLGIRSFTGAGSRAQNFAGLFSPSVCQQRRKLPLTRRSVAPRRGTSLHAPLAVVATPSFDAESSSMFELDASFATLGACDEIVAHLATQNLSVPTRAQAAVVPALLAGLCRQLQYGASIRRAEADFEAAQKLALEMQGTSDDVPAPVYERPLPPNPDPDDVIMLGAETGSGKTLAYLLPYIEALRRNPNSPVKAIIMVPSRELCSQVARQLKSYFPDAPPHLILAGGLPPDVDDVKNVRIVIATPAALLNYFRFSTKIDGNDKYIVVDEADMLLTGSFCGQVTEILNQPGMKPFAMRKNRSQRALNRNRLLFVGATYPHWTGERVKSIVTWMKQRYPQIRNVQTSDIHKRSSGISEQWHLLETDAERLNKLLDILSRTCSEDDKVMVFCGQASSAEDLCVRLAQDSEELVTSKFGRVERLHKHVPVLEREAALDKFRAGVSRLLVCTDLAARGLDLGNVTRVIEYDFSTNVVGYLHRIGRTARAGALGKTDHFYTSSTQSLAEAIRSRSNENVNVVDGVFSRDRSFRRKLRKRERMSEEE